MFAQVLVGAQDDPAGTELGVLISQRNTAAVAAVRQALQQGQTKLAVLYGAC